MPVEGATLTQIKKETHKEDGENLINSFLGSDLVINGINDCDHLPKLLSEESFVVPAKDVRNCLPEAREGRRHLTEAQKHAQFNAGLEFPAEVLKALFKNCGMQPNHGALVFNIGGYDACLENAVLHGKMNGDFNIKMSTFTTCFNPTYKTFITDNIAEYLLSVPAKLRC